VALGIPFRNSVICASGGACASIRNVTGPPSASTSPIDAVREPLDAVNRSAAGPARASIVE
jgi:hypothetical protein